MKMPKSKSGHAWIIEGRLAHISLSSLWEVHTKLRLLSDDEALHLAGCDNCLVAFVFCRISKSLEQAHRRLQAHLRLD